jgi:hypothetical protein
MNMYKVHTVERWIKKAKAAVIVQLTSMHIMSIRYVRRKIYLHGYICTCMHVHVVNVFGLKLFLSPEVIFYNLSSPYGSPTGEVCSLGVSLAPGGEL